MSVMRSRATGSAASSASAPRSAVGYPTTRSSLVPWAQSHSASRSE